VLRLLPAHVREEHAAELALACSHPDERVSPGALFLDVVRAAPAAHWDVVRQDLSLALRQLWRAPLFAGLAVATLGLGVGGNLAFFTLADAVLFRPLGLLGEDRLVSLTEENQSRGLRDFGTSPGNFRDFTADGRVFEAAAAYQVRSATLRSGDDRSRILGAVVSGGFFSVFRERPLAGRTLQPSDDVVGSSVVVVSHHFHESTLGGDPSAVGRTIEVDGRLLQVVGVMPSGFDFPAPEVDLWRPLAIPPDEWTQRGARYVSAVARLRATRTIADAQSHLAGIASSLGEIHPESNRDWSVKVQSLRDAQVADARQPLLLVWAAGSLVLLVAVANVAGLFLARGVAREREFALRSALGARTGRVARQVATEAAVLSVIGTLLGLALATVTVRMMQLRAAGALPRLDEVALGGRTVAVAALVAILTTALLSFVTAPAGRARSVWGALSTGRASTTHRRWRLHMGIVSSEVALATFVLIGASLVTRTMWRILHQPLGFEPTGVVTFRVEPPFHLDPSLPPDRVIAALVADRRRVNEGYRSLLASLRAQPGVSAAGAINRLPLSGAHWVTSVGVPGRPSTSTDGRHSTWVRPVTSGYLETMGTRIVRGRTLTPSDDAAGERVVVVDQAFARRVWGDADPVGEALVLDGPPEVAGHARVVGVAETVRMNRLDAEPLGTMYLPLAQSMEGFFPNWGMDIVVRGPLASQDLATYPGLVRDALPDAVAFGARTVDSLVRASLADRRFHLLVLGVFALLALLLATVGIGAALTLMVRERSKELAVRLALGAGAGRLWWEVQSRGMAIAGAGLAIGTALALVAWPLFASLVHGLPTRDPVSYLVAPFLLSVAAFVAVALPAWLASKIRPAAALRAG